MTKSYVLFEYEGVIQIYLGILILTVSFNFVIGYLKKALFDLYFPPLQYMGNVYPFFTHLK